jgi:hypothetical protein
MFSAVSRKQHFTYPLDQSRARVSRLWEMNGGFAVTGKF